MGIFTWGMSMILVKFFYGINIFEKPKHKGTLDNGKTTNPSPRFSEKDILIEKNKGNISVSEAQKQFKIMVNDIFENSIQYMKGKCIGAEDVDNVLVYQAIKETYKSLIEEKEQLILISGFTNKEFDMYLEQVRDQKIAKYIKSNE